MKSKIDILSTILKGFVLVILGVITIAMPQDTLAGLTLYFGIAVGVRGCYLLYRGFSKKREKSAKSWLVFNALMDILFGLVLIVHPEISLELLPFIIGMWAILSGLLESAIAATKNLKKTWPKFLFGIVILVFGWCILLHPVSAGIALSELLGGLLIFMGLGYMVIDISLHKLIFWIYTLK